jgi:hypothetical protein
VYLVFHFGAEPEASVPLVAQSTPQTVRPPVSAKAVVPLQPAVAEQACLEDGKNVTLRGSVGPQTIKLADGSDHTVLILDTPEAMCINEVDPNTARMERSTASRFQIVGPAPLGGSPREITGKLTTSNVTQYYAVPNAIEVVNVQVPGDTSPPVDASPESRLSKSHAPPVQFDQRAADEAETLRHLAAQTTECMDGGALAMLRLGNRDADQIVAFQVQTCGGPLQHFTEQVSDKAGGKAMTKEQARLIVVALAQRRLNLLLQQGSQ